MLAIALTKLAYSRRLLVCSYLATRQGYMLIQMNKLGCYFLPPPSNIAAFTPYPPEPLIPYPYCDTGAFIASRWIATNY